MEMTTTFQTSLSNCKETCDLNGWVLGRSDQVDGKKHCILTDQATANYPLHKCTVDPILPAICEKNIYCFICPTTSVKIHFIKSFNFRIMILCIDVHFTHNMTICGLAFLTPRKHRKQYKSKNLSFNLALLILSESTSPSQSTTQVMS